MFPACNRPSRRVTAMRASTPTRSSTAAPRPVVRHAASAPKSTIAVAPAIRAPIDTGSASRSSAVAPCVATNRASARNDRRGSRWSGGGVFIAQLHPDMQRPAIRPKG
jgi:hypothetical protein